MFDDSVYSDSEGNLCYPYPPGYYSDLNDFGCDRILIVKIQEALKLRGYNIRITGKFDNKSKAVLSQFQKDNGLPSCGNWQVLMKELDLKYQ